MNSFSVLSDTVSTQETRTCTDIYWMEQANSEVPVRNEWLSDREASCLAGMHFPKRRADWRLGRWTAKQALAACFNLPVDLNALANIEIVASSSGAPEPLVFNQPAPVTISLSHRDGLALSAVGPRQTSLGCDLETIEPRSDAFVADYFTPNEQALAKQAAADQRPLLIALLWSAKESALKALHTGLRLDTNSVEVSLASIVESKNDHRSEGSCPVLQLGAHSATWSPLQVCYGNTQIFQGWWRHTHHLVHTIVSDLPLHSPLPCQLFGL